MTLSPNYRQDEVEALDPEIKTYLDKHYLPTLQHLDDVNPKLLVIFSGGSAVGKSALADTISERFKAIRIENDAIKRELLKLNPAYTMREMSPITWNYTMELYANLSKLTSNGLVVRDGTIAWYYDRILPMFEKQGYELFIIDYDLSPGKMKELIEARGDTPTTTAARLLELIDEHVLHGKRFRQAYRPDVTLTDETVFDHVTVLETLAKRLPAS